MWLMEISAVQEIGLKDGVNGSLDGVIEVMFLFFD